MPADCYRGLQTRLQALIGSVLLLSIFPATMYAGGGPENVFLLVNARSESSKTIANHYIRLRQIPACNVLYLDWTGSVERITSDEFREKILSPVLSVIGKRGLGDQIDYLIYSSDFPWSVKAHKDFGEKQPPKQLAPIGSINGMTYLWRIVAAKNRGMISLQNNFYAQRTTTKTAKTTSSGFRSWYGWAPGGKLMESGGQNYLLSTMLGITSGRGNSVDEVINYLRRSAGADGTRPKGTIYYLKNGNVRSTTRDWAFEAAVAELKDLGVKAEIISGKLPQRKLDVQGAMIGTSDFDWKKSGSQISRGAICEHLTSLGGILSKGAGQTPLSEFLRHGAAGASGTVTEPYAIQDKFPLASMHVHYARGCTLAESFYQSVSGPYQLLIVGDPLCRPWAAIPRVSVAGIEAGQTIKGMVAFKPSARISQGHRVDRFELFIDGRRFMRCGSGDTFELDSARLTDGYHEFRIVALEASPIESQGRLILPVIVSNQGKAVEFRTTSRPKVRAGDKLKLEASCPGAETLLVLHNQRLIGKIMGSEGTVEVQASSLGKGPVELEVIAQGATTIRSKPLMLTIE